MSFFSTQDVINKHKSLLEYHKSFECRLSSRVERGSEDLGGGRRLPYKKGGVAHRAFQGLKHCYDIPLQTVFSPIRASV